MLVIRMQRTGRSGHAQFRVVVQDSRRTPTSGKIVASLGHYNPHTKETVINKEKASFYLEHGAQPSERVARLLKSEGVKLPKWVAIATKKSGAVKNADKRRSTRPEGAPEPAPKPAAESGEAPVAADEPATTEPTEAAEAETPTEEGVEAEPVPETETVETTEETTAEPETAAASEETAETVEEPATEVVPETTENTESSDKPAK